MASTRTDVHRPSALVTEDYEFAYAYDAHPEDGDRQFTWPILQALNADGWRFKQVHGGDTCDHCGTHLRYVAVLKHLPSHSLIKVGETCLDNRFSLATAEFHDLRKRAKLDRERLARKAEYEEWLAGDEAKRVIPWLTAQVEAGNYGFDGFYEDLLRKAPRNGGLTPRQVEAVDRAIEREAKWARERAEREAAEAENPPVAIPAEVLDGRVLITGEVVKLKWVDTQYGSTEKMIVRDDRGFKIWGTVPRSIDPSVGDRVSFEAKVEQSDRDDCFGFASRPTKAEVLG